MKKLKSLLIASSTLLFLTACGTESVEETDPLDEPIENAEDAVEDIEEQVDEVTEDEQSEDEENTDQTFTRDELSEYNGKNGKPAYVAVDGIVYDVTDVESWSEGEHAENLEAGNDYSSEITEADHGDSVLTDLPVVGTLAEE